MSNRSNGGCLVALLILIVGFMILGPLVLILLPVLVLLAGGRLFPGLSGASSRPGAHHGAGYTGGGQRVASTPVLVLFAAVMKADGRIMRSELDYVRSFLIRSFGSARAQGLLLELRDLLRAPLPLQQACMQIRFAYSPQQREQLMRMLFELALSDGYIDPKERVVLGRIAQGIGVEDRDYSRVYSEYRQQDVDYYAQLGITRAATNEEVRKAYKKLALQWHPDRYNAQGPEEQKRANAKFQEINAAYDAICKQRGMK